MDPNVLVSAAISPFGAPRELLLDWHHAELFQMLVSYDLLYELEAVLLRSRFRRYLAFSDVLEYVSWLRDNSMFVLDAPPLEDWLVEKFSLAREYRADYLITGDRGLLGMSDLFASATLDLPGLAVLTPRDFVQQIEPSGS